MKQVRTGHGLLWACDNCGGRAVGVELLRRTFTPESINPLWLHAIREEGQSSCRCPSCRNPMIEVRLSDAALIKVDVCRICHFVWFDAHETETLVPRPMLPKKEKVKPIIRPVDRADFYTEPPDDWWHYIAELLGMHI